MGCSVVVKTQSAKICLNFNFEGSGCSIVVKNSKCQDLLGEVVCSVLVKTQSAEIWLTFHSRGVGGILDQISE